MTTFNHITRTPYRNSQTTLYIFHDKTRTSPVKTLKVVLIYNPTKKCMKYRKYTKRYELSQRKDKTNISVVALQVLYITQRKATRKHYLSH